MLIKLFWYLFKKDKIKKILEYNEYIYIFFFYDKKIKHF